MKFELELSNCRVVRSHGTDKIFIDFNGTKPYPKGVPEQDASLMIDVARGLAEEYIETNFPGLEYKVINAT